MKDCFFLQTAFGLKKPILVLIIGSVMSLVITTEVAAQTAPTVSRTVELIRELGLEESKIEFSLQEQTLDQLKDATRYGTYGGTQLSGAHDYESGTQEIQFSKLKFPKSDLVSIEINGRSFEAEVLTAENKMEFLDFLRVQKAPFSEREDWWNYRFLIHRNEQGVITKLSAKISSGTYDGSSATPVIVIPLTSLKHNNETNNKCVSAFN